MSFGTVDYVASKTLPASVDVGLSTLYTFGTVLSCDGIKYFALYTNINHHLVITIMLLFGFVFFENTHSRPSR